VTLNRLPEGSGGGYYYYQYGAYGAEHEGQADAVRGAPVADESR
jgi:hypothetical protein